MKKVSVKQAAKVIGGYGVAPAPMGVLGGYSSWADNFDKVPVNLHEVTYSVPGFPSYTQCMGEIQYIVKSTGEYVGKQTSWFPMYMCRGN